MEKLTYKTQKELIEYSIKNEIPFEEILSKNGLDYNSLVYSDEAKIEDFSFSEFTPVNERKPVASNIPCVSFFSGAGGLDLGFKYDRLYSLLYWTGAVSRKRSCVWTVLLFNEEICEV